jgi:hypothetical protein
MPIFGGMSTGSIGAAAAAAARAAAEAAGAATTPIPSTPAGADPGNAWSDIQEKMRMINSGWIKDAGGAVGGVATDVGGARPGGGFGGVFGDIGGAIPWFPIREQPTPAGTFERRKPYTQLAMNATNLLRAASRETLNEAIERASGKQIAAEDLMSWLERRTRIGEVLSNPASAWSAETLNDFAQAFQMPALPAQAAVMDALVAMAVLNWPELEGELRDENTAAVTGADLLQNRRVIFQYPPPGTPLEPPYVILVAVEHQDTRRADEVVGSIFSSLVPQRGYKFPREAAAKFG